MPNLNDVVGWIKDIYRELARLKSGAFLENASISSGRLRLIGGTLRVDSGGRVEIVGTLRVDGSTTATGQFDVEGPWAFTGDGTITGRFTVEGPWSLRGDGEISGRLTVSGPVTITGDVDLTGKMTVAGEIIVNGSGRVRIGDMVLDPSIAGGALVFGNGSRLEADGGNSGVRLLAGDSVVNVGAVASIRKGSSAVSVAPEQVMINAANGGDVSLVGRVRMTAGNIPTYGGTGLPLGTLRLTNTGSVERADGT